jgi:hypothetical protein
VKSQINRENISLLRFTRGAGYLSVIGLCILFGVIIYSSYWISSLSREISSLEEKRTALTDEISELALVRDRLNGSIKSLSEVAKAAPPSPQGVDTIRAAENARYTIQCWGYQVDPAKFDNLVRSITDNGYTVTKGAVLPSRPSWLATKPVVLYY